MKTVCLSLKELYSSNRGTLQNGGRIDCNVEEAGNEYYDLIANNEELIACDGEEFEIVNMMDDSVVLRNIMSDRRLYLTKNEYNIAVFM